MKCDRCGGPMIFEKFYGRTEDYFGWRYIVCGEIVDQVILGEPISKETLTAYRKKMIKEVTSSRFFSPSYKLSF
jgi:hypothetical protein